MDQRFVSADELRAYLTVARDLGLVKLSLYPHGGFSAELGARADAAPQDADDVVDADAQARREYASILFGASGG